MRSKSATLALVGGSVLTFAEWDGAVSGRLAPQGAGAAPHGAEPAPRGAETAPRGAETAPRGVDVTFTPLDGAGVASTPRQHAERTATAIAIDGDRIVAVGADRDIERLIGPKTRVLALAGRAVIPGINDSHLHAAWLGTMWPRTLLGDGTTAGGGGTAGDRARAGGGGTAEARSGMGTRAGVGDGADPMRPRLATEADRRATIMRAGDICAELGITSYTEPGLGPGEDEESAFGARMLASYAALADGGKLRARVTALRLFGTLDGPSTLAAFCAGVADIPPIGCDARWFAVTGVKIFADGIPPMRSAWTRHSYPDRTHGGLLVAGRDDADREANLRAMIRNAAAGGLQVGVHATGDRAIDVVADELATCRAWTSAAPHYIVHGDLISRAAIAAMSRHGIGISVQPGIAIATRELVSQDLGDEAGAAAWPLADLLARGVPVTLSSDAPVLSPDWRGQLVAAGVLLGMPGTHPALMTRLLRCYTTVAAAQDGALAWKGSLEPGKVADLCVLSEDPRFVPLAEARRLHVLATVVGGRVVYEMSDLCLTGARDSTDCQAHVWDKPIRQQPCGSPGSAPLGRYGRATSTSSPTDLSSLECQVNDELEIGKTGGNFTTTAELFSQGGDLDRRSEWHLTLADEHGWAIGHGCAAAPPGSKQGKNGEPGTATKQKPTTPAHCCAT